MSSSLYANFYANKTAANQQKYNNRRLKTDCVYDKCSNTILMNTTVNVLVEHSNHAIVVVINKGYYILRGNRDALSRDHICSRSLHLVIRSESRYFFINQCLVDQPNTSSARRSSRVELICFHATITLDHIFSSMRLPLPGILAVLSRTLVCPAHSSQLISSRLRSEVMLNFLTIKQCCVGLIRCSVNSSYKTNCVYNTRESARFMNQFQSYIMQCMHNILPIFCLNHTQVMYRQKIPS